MKNKIFPSIFINFIIYILFLSNAFSQSGWISQTIGTRNYVAVKFINPTTGYLIGSDGAILKTTNQGLNWIINSTSVFNSPVLSGFITDENNFAVLAGGISYAMVYTSSNGGNNWVSGINDIRPLGNGYIWLKGLNFINAVTGYVCGSDYGSINGNVYADGIVYKTTNSGLNWFQSHRGGFIFYDVEFNNEMTGYVINGGVVKTINGGINWEFVGEVFEYTYSITAPSNDTIFMSGLGGLTFRSLNGGANWVTFQTPSTDTLKNINFINAITGLSVGSREAIVRTTNAGANWTLQNSGTTRNLNSSWFINKDTGFVVGDNGIVLKTISGGVLVNVNSNNESTPENHSLSQNFPNPFNPATNLEFGVSYLLASRSGGFVSLKVYDLLGEEVAVIVNSQLNSGTYKYVFDGSNLTSGIYFYSLLIDGRVIDTKRMVLLK